MIIQLKKKKEKEKDSLLLYKNITANESKRDKTLNTDNKYW